MKKILFTPGIASVEALGSITRLIAIADEIKKLDKECDILFRAAGREAEYVEASGYKVVRGYKPKFDIQKIARQLGNKEEQENKKFHMRSFSDVMKLKCLISSEYIENTFNEEMELVQSFKPDLIFGEFETVMPIVAKKMNIEYFSTGGTPSKEDFSCFGFSNKTEAGDIENYNKLLKSLNLKTIENICELTQSYNSSKLFIPSIPELEEFEENSKNIFLGSIIPRNFTKSDFEFEKKRPLIYIYLSVGEIDPEVYKRVILETFKDSEFDVIVTTGGNSRFNINLDYDTGNVHFMNMVPADKVMKIADAAIHHGGQNTTVQCIENEVPAIIFPGIHFERYFNAEKAAQIGCALNPGLNNFNKEFLLKSCREIIKDTAFKENLKKYSEKIKNYGGAAKAAEIILNY